MGRRIALILLVLGLLIVPSLCRTNASVRRAVAASAASSQGNESEEDAGMGDGNGEGVGEAMEGRAMDPLATGTQCNVTGACLICTEQQKVEDPACQPTGYRQAISCIERYSGAVSSLPSARARSAGATKPRGGVVRGARQARGEAESGRGRDGMDGAGGEGGGELQVGGGEDGAGEGREAQEISSDGRSGGSERSGSNGSSGRRIQEETGGVSGSERGSGEGLGSGEQQRVDETVGGLSGTGPRRVRLQEERVGGGEFREGVLAVGGEEGNWLGNSHEVSVSARGDGTMENETSEKFEEKVSWEGQREGTAGGGEGDLLRRLLGEVRTVQVAGRVSSMEASAEEEGARGSSTGSGAGEGVGEERMRRFLTYESCKPEVETLSVLGFEVSPAGARLTWAYGARASHPLLPFLFPCFIAAVARAAFSCTWLPFLHLRIHVASVQSIPCPDSRMDARVQGIMLAILAVCGPIVYHRKRKVGMQAGNVRLSNSSNRF
ncbi:unnamed protein product [Closterium sp. Naga37s-1]|nr:unnamed protein product [Closterium sp. Naga37s-1]